MKCIFRGWCSSRAMDDECGALEEECEFRVSDDQYRHLKTEVVDPEHCRGCGFKGTPLCTHPDGYYQEEPAGINKLLEEGR